MSDYPWHGEAALEDLRCAFADAREDADGYDRYWRCPMDGTVEVGGELMCDDHAQTTAARTDQT